MILGVIQGILGEAKGLIGSIVKDPNQAAQLEHGLQKLMLEKGSEAEIEEIKGKTAIITEELKQSDKFTKRARPWIIYSGLIVVGINSVLMPWLAWIITTVMKMTLELPRIETPGEFWTAWGAVVSIYVIGRTVEKSKGKV